MASATTPIFKPMADCSSLLSLPSIFTTKPTISYLPIQPKPFRLQLSCSYSAIFAHSPLSLKKKTLSSSIVAFVAQQEDSTAQVVVEEEEEEATWENQELDASGAPISDWESEGEDASVKAASGEEIGEGVAEEEGDGEGEGEVFQEPSEDAKIFIGNLPYDVDSESLAQMFQKAGSVEIAEVIYNRETDQSRGFGFVTMSTVEEAEKAVEIFNRYMVNGRPLTVNKAAPRGSRAERPPRVSEPAIRIYVGNLPWDVDNSRLEQIFSEHGKVVEARVVFDRETGRSRGFGFVTMSSQTEMNDAIGALDGESLEGRPIRVNVAEERPRRNFF